LVVLLRNFHDTNHIAECVQLWEAGWKSSKDGPGGRMGVRRHVTKLWRGLKERCDGPQLYQLHQESSASLVAEFQLDDDHSSKMCRARRSSLVLGVGTVAGAYPK
jgi:hypothetical protein